MNGHVEYLWYLVKHKWFVFVECCKLGIPWLGIVHDWSKFLPSEWFPYVDHFYGSEVQRDRGRNETGYYKPTDTGDPAFDFAWFMHQKRNKHHWQYWVLPDGRELVKVLLPPSKYQREMLADWYGAAQAQGKSCDSVVAWYAKNKLRMRIHPDAQQWIEGELGAYDA